MARMKKGKERKKGREEHEERKVCRKKKENTM